MAEVKWVKVATDMFESRKIKQIEAMPKGDTVIAIWLKMLLLAGQINDGGAIYITPENPYTEKALAAELRRELGDQVYHSYPSYHDQIAKVLHIDTRSDHHHYDRTTHHYTTTKIWL